MDSSKSPTSPDRVQQMLVELQDQLANDDTIDEQCLEEYLDELDYDPSAEQDLEVLGQDEHEYGVEDAMASSQLDTASTHSQRPSPDPTTPPPAQPGNSDLRATPEQADPPSESHQPSPKSAQDDGGTDCDTESTAAPARDKRFRIEPPPEEERSSKEELLKFIHKWTGETGYD